MEGSHLGWCGPLFLVVCGALCWQLGVTVRTVRFVKAEARGNDFLVIDAALAGGAYSAMARPERRP